MTFGSNAILPGLFSVTQPFFQQPSYAELAKDFIIAMQEVTASYAAEDLVTSMQQWAAADLVGTKQMLAVVHGCAKVFIIAMQVDLSGRLICPCRLICPGSGSLGLRSLCLF